jgi:hypothetical protein
MHTLEQINGQQHAIDAVLNRSSMAQKQVMVARGPLGSGTSWILDRCADAWQGLDKSALIARGESFARDRHLFPWLTLALPGAKHLARIQVLKDTVSQGSRAVPMIGSVTSYLVEEALDHRRRRLAREALLLTAQEQDLLFVIQASAHNKPLLLVLDHLDTWDEASWSLLALILSSKLDDLYTCLADAQILVGCSGEIPSRLRSLIPNNEFREFDIRLIERQEMPLATATFDFPSLTERDLDLLYAITNGRLDLLHDVARQLRQSDLKSVTSDWVEFYSGLVGRRMEALSIQTRSLENLLSAAAIIGESFTVSDIHCLTGSAMDELNAALGVAAGENLLSSIGDIAQFQSAELHRYFHRAGATNHGKYHAKFAECLRLMRPGDYENRVRHLLLAGDPENALTCYAQAVLAARRDHRHAQSPGELQKHPSWPSIESYLEGMQKAYDAYDSRRIADGLRMLESVETFVPEVLIAERDWLEANFLLLQHSVVSYERARISVERWQTLGNAEAELWSRLGQLLIVAQVMTNRIDEARRLEETLTSSYWNRRQVDSSALYDLNVLRRRSECLHQLPTAAQRLESALAYFGPSSAGDLPKHPVQYYYALNNLIGNQIASGLFDIAYSRALELEFLVRNYRSIPWPALEIAANNVLLARHLSGQASTSELATLIGELIKSSPESGDHMLLQNNQGVFSALAGKVTEAQSLFETLHKKLMADAEPDEYHCYFVGNNLAVLLALAGETKKAADLLAKHSGLLNRFYPGLRGTLLKRHPLVMDALSVATGLNASDFDRYIFEHHPPQVGPQWKFYGHMLLLSDVQFWSAD